MKRPFLARILGSLLLATALASACRPGHPTRTEPRPANPHDHDHDHAHEHEPGEGHDAAPGGDAEEDHDPGHGPKDAHDDEPASPIGGTFRSDKGVVLGEETRSILGLETTEVVIEPLPARTQFTAQIFGEKHHHLPNPADHSGCDVHASGLVTEEVASDLRSGTPVLVQPPNQPPLQGMVLAVQKAIALGEYEVIVGISNAVSVLKPGEFVPASILHPVPPPTAVVPQSALLRSASGTFVYTVHDGAYRRTAVHAGAEANGRVAIIHGLAPGQQVVVKPVQALWLIELRATKGGGHSH